MEARRELIEAVGDRYRKSSEARHSGIEEQGAASVPAEHAGGGLM
jgi:hypothetical protein